MVDFKKNCYFSKYNFLEFVVLAVFIIAKWVVGSDYTPSKEINDAFLVSLIMFFINLISLKTFESVIKIANYEYIMYLLFSLQLVFMIDNLTLSTNLIILIFRLILVFQIILFLLFNFLKKRRKMGNH